MKTIGILGGLGPESTISYYSYITRTYYETHKDYNYPEIVIFSCRFQDYIATEYELPDKVTSAIDRLAKAGADFVVAACNSVHVVYDQVAPNCSIPWVSIIDATGDAITARGFKTIGLLGTIFTMTKGFYQTGLSRHGIEAITPDADACQRINDIIYSELVRGMVTEESRKYVLGCIDQLRNRGAQGIVLGCTELPFLIQQKHTDLPVFDTTTLHAQRALELAIADK